MAKEIAGVVPIIESHLPDPGAKGERWFSMPLARDFGNFISGKKPVEIAREFVNLAETLSRLHSLQIYHRDIKPGNLLWLAGRLCFSDFGLVKFPERGEITPLRSDVGPEFTMAPEMRRNAKHSNGGPADVYSLAKTLWVALTGVPSAFDGQYAPDSSVGMSQYLSATYITALDVLILECTDNEPSERPPAEELAFRLREWIDLAEDFEKRNLKEWMEVQDKLFPSGSPRTAIWTDVDAICSVLRLVARVPSLNHMFFPDGGGMTIQGVSKSAEEGHIVLHHGSNTVLKPSKVTFESFGAGSEWNYFRLEAERIRPIGTKGEYTMSRGFREELCELTPGHYVARDAWEYGEHNGRPLPESARPIARYLRGSFVIFSTRSSYNLDPSTYDARHEGMGEKGFRAYIERQVQASA